MKKIKLFINTYNRPDALNKTLERLFLTDFVKVKNTEVVIINNHNNFYLKEKFIKKVKTLHNQTRPDWSLGNLSESWNQCLLFGFKNLAKPDSEIVAHIQDDCSLATNWCQNLFTMHKKYDFVFGSLGDNFVSYTAEAIRNIGIWDENFCGLQYKEADYCIRALIHLKERSIINDKLANLYHNHEDWLEVITTEDLNYINRGKQVIRLPDDNHHDQIKRRCTSHRHVLINYFTDKWKDTWKKPPTKNGWICNWEKDFITNPPAYPKHFKQYFRYFYFEKDIYNLKGKGYLL